MNLFQSGKFTLHSGQESQWKIDCDALTDVDWDTIALMVLERIPKFWMVLDVPQGGLKFAKALRKYCEGDEKNNPPLVVDDVLTTGASMEEVKKGLILGGAKQVNGVVLFARGPCPEWITPIFTLTPILVDATRPRNFSEE